MTTFRADLCRLLLFFVLKYATCIELDEFYPFGPHTRGSSQKLRKGNDEVSQPVFPQDIGFQFYCEIQDILTVTTNGAIGFGIDPPRYTSNPFPLSGLSSKMIAPFWADADTTRGDGNVWYRQSTDQEDLKRATNEVKEAYPFTVPNNFNASLLFIVTWDHVGYFNSKNDKTNTFQCILVTDEKMSDEKRSFAIFLYANGLMQWTTGDNQGGTNGLGGTPAQVGFNKGTDDKSNVIRQSRTADVDNLDELSNIGIPGMMIFEITGCDGIPVEQKCDHMGTEYQLGEVIEPSCSKRCICRAGGKFECNDQMCTFNGPECNVNGDPHYKTFDSPSYLHHFQGTCEYVLTKPCANDDFTVSAKNDGHNDHVSCVSSVTISVPGDNIKIVLGRGNGGTVTINGVAKPNIGDEVIFNQNGVEVVRTGGHPVVFLNRSGLRLSWNGWYQVIIKVSSRLQNQLCGLCGTYNGTTADDFTKPDGTLTTSLNEFGNSWLVPSANTPGCGSVAVGKRSAPVIPGCSTDPSIVAQGRSRCNELKQGPFKPCNDVVDPKTFIENCEFDYCCCSDEEREDCYCDALSTYAAACASKGVPPSNWRRSFCSVDCPEGMVYQQCGPLCPQTCDNIGEFCEGGCAEGCFCPDGQLLLNGKCVSPVLCTACEHMGETYLEGDQIQPNCSTRCTCQNREFQCITQACSVNGPTCIGFGDSHYQTFDLDYYEFQGNCTYVLSKPCDDDEFIITVQHSKVSEHTSSISQVTITVQETDLEIVLGQGNGGTVNINDDLHPNYGDGAILISNEAEVIRAGGYLHVFLITQDIRLFWNGNNRVQVTVSTKWIKKLCGLCGNYSNDASDDFLTPKGMIASSVDEFVSAWVSNNDTCGMLAPAPRCVGSLRREAELRCAILMRSIFASCNALLSPSQFIRDCVFDYCNCVGDRENCYCDSLATYAAACELVGSPLLHWRELYCSAECPENMIFHQCGSLCPSTCDTTTITCRSGCAEGCFCKDGYVVDDYGRCQRYCPEYTNEGNQFCIGFFTNRFGRIDDKEISPVIWVTTSESSPVSFTVYTKGGVLANDIAYPGKITYIRVPVFYIVSDSAQSDINERFKGICIETHDSKKVVVLGQNEQTASNDAFLALPNSPIPRKLTQDYIAVSYFGGGSSGQEARDSVVLIVGFENNTTITIIPPASIFLIHYYLAPIGVFINGHDNPLNSITIDKYQTVYLQVRGEDITGTRIIADKPISVFAGHECADVPGHLRPCDILIEQMTPTDTWGTQAVVVPLTTRLGGDIVKVVASQDSTIVHITGTDVTGVVTADSSFMLNASDFKELLIEDFSLITSNYPIAVFQFSRSFEADGVISADPFMMMVPTCGQYDDSFTIATAPFDPSIVTSGRGPYKNYTNVVVPAEYFDASMFTINNQSIDASEFKPIKYADGTTWGYGAQMTLNEGAQLVSHHNPNATWSLTIYGFSNQMSYGYAGGMKLELITPVTCVPLNAPENGTISCISGHGSVGDVMCNFTCDEGYVLVGSTTRICSQCDGKWSGGEVTCTKALCPPLEVPINGMIDCSERNQMCTIACDNCFELTGSATRTCQDDGTWTGNEAQCMKACNVQMITGKFKRNRGAMKTSAIASFSADDPAATFNCKLDNGEFEPCTSPMKYTDLSVGRHSLTVEAKCPNNCGSPVHKNIGVRIR